MYTNIVILLSILSSLSFARETVQWSEYPGRYMIVGEEILDLTEKIPDTVVSDQQVTFYYSSRQTKNEVEMFVDESQVLNGTDFDPNRETLYIVHGWNNGKNSEINTETRKAVLEAVDWNVIVVAWPARDLYTQSKARVQGVGEILYRFVASTGQELQLVNIEGHSLGAHVAGHAGRLLGRTVARIAGLDPAYPFFDVNNPDDHLDATDAVYVEVVHTCAGFLGFKTPLGHSDFYPNGGRNQPGCGVDLLGICAHGRAHNYFAESLKGGKFWSTKCDSYNDFLNGKCDGNVRSLMGTTDSIAKPEGTFFLDTSSEAPYALIS